MTNRIKTTFHNVEFYYLYAATIYSFSQILWKILYRWKRRDEQISEHFQNVFRKSKFVIFMQPPYTNFQKYYEKFLLLEDLWWAEFRPLLGMSKFIIFVHAPYINFSKILWTILYLCKRHNEQNSENCSEHRSLLFLSSPHILIFKYIINHLLPLDASWWAEFRTIVRMSKYIIFRQPAYIHFTILWKILYRWKRHDEQNSDQFSEWRSLLFLCSRRI